MKLARKQAPPKKWGSLPDEGEFRLAISREGVGIELTRPIAVGAFRVAELAWSFPTLRFPIDISGGIDSFRHRLGKLERLVIEVDKESLRSLIEREARHILRGASVTVRGERRGAKIGISFPGGAFAVDAFVDVSGHRLRCVFERARGVGLTAVPSVLAAQIVGAASGIDPHGSIFVLDDLASSLLRGLLPFRGFRLPTTSDVRCNVLTHAHDAWVIQLSTHVTDLEPDESTVLAIEWAERLAAIDDSLRSSKLDEARWRCLQELEDAPRSAAVLSRLLDLDRHVAGREEAALSFDTVPDLVLDIIRGELFERRGDREEALSLYLRAAEEEPTPALAASLLGRASRLSADPLLALDWLDRAIQRSPRDTALLYERLERNVALDRVDRAEVDGELLEALAETEDEKVAVWGRLADRLTRRGHSATRALRRALRFRPNDSAVLASLGGALAREGETNRGVTLLQQSLERSPEAEWAAKATLDLAKALAEALGDAPLAIHCLSKLGARATIATLALEAHLRADLLDREGASLCYARLRTKIEGSVLDADDRLRALEALQEASRFEEIDRGDIRAAQRHTLVAIRLAPSDQELRERARALGGPRVLTSRGPSEEAPEETIEALTDKVRANPSDARAVSRLADRLEQAGLFHELLALLSARLEEGATEFRERYRSALNLAKEHAERAGNAEEADAYRSMLATVD